MTEFDKLIKEKAEQAEYDYKPAAWRRFHRSAGIGHAAWKYWVSGISCAVIVGGTVAFMLGRGSQPLQDASRATQTVAADSSCVNLQPAIMSDTLLVTETTSAETVVSRERRAPVEERDVPSSQVTTVPSSAVTSTKATETQQRHGRPMVIDVDTIKDNVPTDEELRNGHSRLF